MKTLLAILVSVLLIAGCSKKEEPKDESIAGVLRALAESENYEQIAACYSSDTMSIVSDIIASKKASKAEFEPLLGFLRGALSWNIVSEKTTENEAELYIMISDHVIDNMIGWSLSCRMKKEEGKWRIDMKHEMAAMRDSFKEGLEKKYLNKRLKNYM